MNLQRAIVLMFAGLAGGIGARLALTPSPPGMDRRDAVPGPERTSLVIGPPAAEKTPRPAESDILNATGGRRLRMLLAWLPGATGVDLPRMADSLARREMEENFSIRLLMARWAEVDPAAMLAWSKKQRDTTPGAESLANHAIEAWAREDFDAAWSAAGAGMPEARGWVLLGLTAVNPGKCRDLLRSDPLLMDMSDRAPMKQVLSRIAARDPAGAATLFEGGPTARLYRYCGGVAVAWAKSDPAACAAWIQRLDPVVRGEAMDEAARCIAMRAGEQLPALLESLPAGRFRSMASSAGFSRLAATDPAVAQRQVETMPASPTRQFFRGLLMTELLRRGDEAGAMTLAAQIGWKVEDAWCPGIERVRLSSTYSTGRKGDDGSDSIDNALIDLMGRIAVRDPAEAAALFAKCHGNAVRSVLTDEREIDHRALATAMLAMGTGERTNGQHWDLVVAAWATRDPAAAAAWVVENVGTGEFRDKLIATVIYRWTEDPPAMVQWAQSMNAETVSAAWRQLLSEVPDYIASHLEFFVANAGPLEIESSLLARRFEPETERNLLRRLPNEMDVRIEGAVQRWIEDEPEAASEWVRRLPPGLRRTEATEAMVTQLNRTGDHERAFAWAATLPAESRSQRLTETLTAWSSGDRRAAEAAIRSSAIPAQEQQELLNSMPPP